MATTKKKTTKAKAKTGLISKIKSLVKGKKASPGRAIKNALKTKKSTRLAISETEDPAHAPGHRKMNLKNKEGGKKNRAQDESSLNNMTRSARIAQNESNQRKVITGAAVGKAGRR